MATDLFNNPSNDYVNPGLSPCAGAGDDAYFEIGNGAAEITSGSDILAKLDLSDIKIGVSAYSIQNQILSEGEVAYIPGLTKGLQKKVQGFTMPTLVSNDSTLNPYFFTIDLSLHYYKNFKYVSVAIDTSSNYGQNLNIGDALNIALDGINITASYDPSNLKFTGTVDGFDFTVSNIVLGIIDASENSSSPFDKDANAEEYTLAEDSRLFVPYAKYPNGASQGIVMKGIYPITTPQTPYDKWLYINHVTDFITIYEPVEVDNFIENIRKEVTLTFDPSITFGPFINDVSLNIPVFDCSGAWDYDPSVITTIPQGVPVDNSIAQYVSIEDSSITNSTILYSEISNIAPLSFNSIYDSSILGSDIWNDNPPTGISIQESFISDSSVSQMNIRDSFVQSSWLKSLYVVDSSLVCMIDISDSSLGGVDIVKSIVNHTEIYDSNLYLSTVDDSSLYVVNVKDSSITNTYLESCLLQDSDVSLGVVLGSVSQNTYYSHVTIQDSSIIGSAIDSSSLVIGSTLQGIYTNAYRLVTGDPSMPYIWVIDDPTLTIDDSSSRITIQVSTILDASINNADIEDSSIYTSYLQDVSLSGCTLYNVTVDSSSTTLTDCKIIYINSTQDCSVSYDVDSSIFYNRTVKTIDVGMNGCSTANVMSAGDYLDWVNTNDYWYKFGDLYVWTTAPDGCSSCHNLIDGFYVFNPHPFDIKIEYMLFI